jgi:hypothetical protein
LQPLLTDTLQRPLHGLEFGVQQVPASASQTSLLLEHRPLLPQLTG